MERRSLKGYRPLLNLSISSSEAYTVSLVLKCRRHRSIILSRKRIESDTLIHTSPRHISVLQPLNSSKNLPGPLFSHRTSQPTRGAVARERELSEHTSDCVERRLERAVSGSIWVIVSVGSRESQSAVAGNEDVLSAWDVNLL